MDELYQNATPHSSDTLLLISLEIEFIMKLEECAMREKVILLLVALALITITIIGYTNSEEESDLIRNITHLRYQSYHKFRHA